MADDDNMEEGLTREATLFERIASGGPRTVNAAIEMLNDYGYDEPTGRISLSKALTQVAVEKGEDALKQMAGFHPDKDFILANVSSTLPAPTPKTVNAAGCMKNDCGGAKKSDTGAPGAGAALSADAQSQQMSLYHMAVIVILGMGGIVVLGLVLMFGHSYLQHHLHRSK